MEMRSAMCPALAVVHPPSQGPHPRRGAGNESPKAYVYVLHREARISFLSFFVARSGAIKPTPQGVCTPSGENSSSERRLGRIVLPKGTRVNRKMTGKMTGKCSATCRAFRSSLALVCRYYAVRHSGVDLMVEVFFLGACLIFASD